MASNFKYWDDCVDAEEMQSLWMDPSVNKEWTDVGESEGKKVHLSRDPDGQPFLTQTEMRAVAGIIVQRHFPSQLEPEMICAIAEIGSDRQPLALRYDKKTKETRIGIMQVTQTTAEWLVREMGYHAYDIVGNTELLHRPFINVYFGAAYILWLSSYDGKEQSEEFIVRAYRGGIKKATHKSTLDFYERYLSAKENLPSWRAAQTSWDPPLAYAAASASVTDSLKAGDGWTYWDSRVSQEDMDELWKNPEVQKEWTKSGERRGRVRFSHDSKKRPYLSRVEVKVVASITISRHFNTSGIGAAALAAIAEMCSMRFVNGVRARTGLMGVDFPTAVWLYKDVGRRAYKVESVDDLYNPFVSMYFGASYLAHLSAYEGRERTLQFVVQAYLAGPENVNLQETGPFWTKFQEMLCCYEDPKNRPHCAAEGALQRRRAAAEVPSLRRGGVVRREVRRHPGVVPRQRHPGRRTEAPIRRSRIGRQLDFPRRFRILMGAAAQGPLPARH